MIVMGIFMCIAFILGYYVGRPKKEQPVVVKQAKKIFKKKDDIKLDEATTIMLENINNYDGTGNMQQDVPEEV